MATSEVDVSLEEDLFDMILEYCIVMEVCLV